MNSKKTNAWLTTFQMYKYKHTIKWRFKQISINKSLFLFKEQIQMAEAEPQLLPVLDGAIKKR